MPRTIPVLCLALALLAAAAVPAWADGDGDDALRGDLQRIRARMEGHTDRTEEAEILAVLRGAPPPRFDALVRRLDLHELLEDVDDHFAGPRNRTALLRLLSEDRLGDLSVAARAALVDALQRGHTDPSEERAIARVFLSTAGADLTALEKAIDAGGDHHDLQHLVYVDIDDAGLRRRILAHVAKEARPASELEILSDIDDTLRPNWKDERYPGHVPYPGVLAFYDALDRAVFHAGAPTTDDGRRGDLAFLTARPDDPLGLVEDATHRMLARLGLGNAVVLAGSFTAALGDERIAAEKDRNFERFRALYPGYRFVFIGDSGQGDAILGAKIEADAPAAMAAVLIHDVVGTPPPQRRAWREKGVVFFDTYVGAAVEAHALGLITDRGLGDVTRAAVAGIQRIAFPSEAAARARMDDLARDLARARRVLPDLDVTLPH